MKLLYLYPDLMNLYGDSGNLRALECRLIEQGEEVVIDRIAPGEEPDFCNYDFIYMGSGTERSQKTALGHLCPHAAALRGAMEQGVHALFTGNAASMLGREIIDGDGKSYLGLGLLDFVSREEKNVRYTGDTILCHPDLRDPLVGFINKCESWEGLVTSLFQTVMGKGDFLDQDGEGFIAHNFLGTHLIGPVLVKNPHFHNWMLERLLERDLKPVEHLYEDRAYQVTLQALLKRTGKE